MVKSKATAHTSDLESLASETVRYEKDYARVDREWQACAQDVSSFNAEDARQAQAVRQYEQELGPYERAVTYFDSLPDQKRTQLQFDRLNRWGVNLDKRRSELNSWFNRLNHRHSQLDKRISYLESRDRQLDSWYRRLHERFEELTDVGVKLKRQSDELMAKRPALDQEKEQLEARGRSLISAR